MVLRQVVVQPAAYLVEQAGVDIAPGPSGGISNFQKWGEPNIDPKILGPPKWYLYFWEILIRASKSRAFGDKKGKALGSLGTRQMISVRTAEVC